MKVKIFEIATSCNYEELKKIEAEMNNFLPKHKIKEIHQSGAGAGGTHYDFNNGTHIITIFYDD